MAQHLVARAALDPAQPVVNQPEVPLAHVAVIGILAHVDAGKTSLTERILFDTFFSVIWNLSEVEGRLGDRRGSQRVAQDVHVRHLVVPDDPERLPRVRVDPGLELYGAARLDDSDDDRSRGSGRLRSPCRRTSGAGRVFS